MLINLIYFLLSFSLLYSQGTYNLYSPYMELPSIGDGETMHFGFYLHADIPDSDGDNNGNLDDYYRISINDISATAWHSDDINSDDGNNFWCGDEDVNGYLDGIDVHDVVRFEQALLDSIRAKGSDTLDTIRKEEAISDETKEKLKSFIGDFVASFSSNV